MAPKKFQQNIKLQITYSIVTAKALLSICLLMILLFKKIFKLTWHAKISLVTLNSHLYSGILV